MTSKVLHMRLNRKDLRLIDELKDVYGYDKTSHLIRFILRREVERKVEERILKRVSPMKAS
jgi:hypothetical protein